LRRWGTLSGSILACGVAEERKRIAESRKRKGND
jgi:hypothetical protein